MLALGKIDLARNTLAGRGVRIGAILLASLLLARLTRLIVRRAERLVRAGRDESPEERARRARTVSGVVRSALMFLIVVVASMLVLGEADVDIAPLVAAAGIGGFAIGFGAQSLVRDFLSGFFVIFENQFRVGDVVEIAGKTGAVEQVNLRTTVLRDDSGAVHVVPNGQIVVATNFTKGRRSEEV
ncbi:MAG: mechanosensitive ion channel [Acidobacteria bacterium]|nr:mechanosensitive ion channel [Acidobacteriota bacterium]